MNNKQADIFDKKMILAEHIKKSVKQGSSDDKSEMYDWKFCIPQLALDFLTRYHCICLSSLASENLRGFYKTYINYANIIILDDTNIDMLVQGKIDMFLYEYEEEAYETLNINKLSLREVYSRFKHEYIEWKRKEMHIEKEWASLNSNNCNAVECIRLFDKGYNSIYLVNENDEFVATVCRHNFKEDLLQNNFRRWQNLYVEYIADVGELEKELIMSFAGTRKENIPILKDKKVMANCCKKDYYYYPEVKLQWEYIKPNIVHKYFENKKILISSTTGELGVFCEKYKGIIDITVLDTESLKGYFSGKYDVVIYKSNLWWNPRCILVDINQLFLDLLGVYVENWLKEKRVFYCYFETTSNSNEILNWGKRHYTGHIAPVITKEEIACKKKGEFWMYGDVTSRRCHIENGRRKTTGVPDNRKNKIYFYGECTSLGLYVSDENTIESSLQHKINGKNKDYGIINAGGMYGSYIDRDINSLYLILNENYSTGDIVIQIGFHMWKSELGRKLIDRNYYRLADVYNRVENSYSKIFMDWPGHLTAEGNELVAEYIYEILSTRISLCDCYTKLNQVTQESLTLR